MNVTVFNRLYDSAKAIGIDVTKAKEKSEIYAFHCCLNDMLNQIENIKPAKDTVVWRFPSPTSDFNRAVFTVDNETVVFTKYRERSIGECINSIIPKFFNVSLNNDGMTWEELEAKGKTFFDLENECLRWDVIESW